MKRTLLIIILITIFISFCQHLFSQETSSPYKISLNGFVRADAIFDSRQVVEAREGFLLFYPKKPEFDAEGNDINAHPTFNQYAMTSRLTAKVSGPNLLGAKAFALIEGDFTGASNSENNSMRLRHAYISLQWSKTRLMVGQYWHPLDVPEMIPNVLSLNTGAPFHSFSRQPQVRVDHKLGKFNLVAAASSQRDYTNTGPQGGTQLYLRNSVVPNLHGQIQFKTEVLFVGLGVDYKKLTPRISTDSLYVANESLQNLSFTGFACYNKENLSVKAQYIYGQSLNDHLMMGGFGVVETDPLTNRRSYSPLNFHALWMNAALAFGKWQPSFLLGYTKNSGSKEVINGSVYARGADIDYVYRLAPMITYALGKFSLIAEVEYTVAAYGGNDPNYKVINSSETGNWRIGLGAVYGF